MNPDFPVWDQFRVGGQSVYPRRPNAIGPRYARQGSGSNDTGRFAGKMIVVQTLMDEAAFPWQAVPYRPRSQRCSAPNRSSLDFAALRVTTQRQGDTETRHARIQNLGRVRVVVA